MWQAPSSVYIKDNESSLSQKLLNDNSLKFRCERFHRPLTPTQQIKVYYLKKALKTNKQKMIIIIITSDIDIKKLFKTNRVNIAYNKHERSII